MSSKLCAVAASVVLITASISLSAASQPAQAAEQGIEVPSEKGAALPAIAAVGAAGLVGAFLLGALQGYAEAKNEQKRQVDQTGGIRAFARLGGGNLDHVLD